MIIVFMMIFLETKIVCSCDTVKRVLGRFAT